MIWSLCMAAFGGEDPRLWLEEVESEQSLTWVREQNEQTVEAFSKNKAFQDDQDAIREILDSDAKIPYVSKRGDYLYNFWRDANHSAGLWRRTTMQSYKTESPKWETVLDIDAINKSEEMNWVWHGATCLQPTYERCLVSLSRGGSDADVVREFNTVTKEFLKDGFQLPESKGDPAWRDEDHIYISRDFGEGTLTESGYPRITKLWTRGTPLESAETIYEGNKEDISVSAHRTGPIGKERDFVYQGLTFYTNKEFELTKKGLVEIEKQDSASAGYWNGYMLIELRDDWTVGDKTYKAGSLLAGNYKKYMKGKRDLHVLFEPTPTTSLYRWTQTKDHLVLNILKDVRNQLIALTPGKKGWAKEPIEGLPALGAVGARAVDSKNSNALWFDVDGYLDPPSLWIGELGEQPEKLKETPAWFDSSDMVVSQHFATSKDGTKIPYFQVSPKSPDPKNPTLLYGYGGFEISLTPGYNASVGKTWLSRGGTYVVANIRGGGEYGPRWHQAALKEKRHRAYEDFAAVAKDLVKRGVTTHKQLGARGGSNGGLLMGNMYTLYPELFGAIHCAVPLLDMKRYTKLLAGASWAGEYGDPDDPEQWKFIKTFSPYHNIDEKAEYPPILFTTSTRDDRVHPAHARKMAHALLDVEKNVSYYENIEGGHGGAANNNQRAFMSTLAYHYLWDKLTTPEELPAEAEDE